MGGRSCEGERFRPCPAAGYPELLDELKSAVASARLRAHRVINTELLALYWQIGHKILERQRAEGWGTRVVDRLAVDLRAAFCADARAVQEQPQVHAPDGRRMAPIRNWPTPCWPIALGPRQRPAGQARRPGRARLVRRRGGRARLVAQRAAQPDHEPAYQRAGAAPSNFTDQLPPADSDLAQQLTRDPYVFDFLDLTGSVAERDLETALVSRLQAFLLELGHGFAFVGRQYHFELDGDDFYIDLLFFNWVQFRFVVVELKVAASPRRTLPSSASTSPGSTRTCATPTATPPPSGS